MSLIDTLSALMNSNSLEPFIRTIRFPKYKNLAKNFTINFQYPLTALVGPNGTNKSSILRALYACPDQNNLGHFWFSSSIDPIEEGQGERNCYIHSYRNPHTNLDVEVLKSRIKRGGDPDYWETARPQKALGMTPMPIIPQNQKLPPGRSKTRWQSIAKNVTYIDFRSALSAFDKFFYHTDFKSSSKDKRAFIRQRTPHLKRVIEGKLDSYLFHTKERVINQENRLLSEEERLEISRILGREYTSIYLIRHGFFTADAYTCMLSTSSMSYSEAFAGSGEFAVVKLVTEILASPANSLILLDEPEVSLHPGAQLKLLEFILRQIKIKHHQVIMSTHSPHLLESLPPIAIKVLQIDKSSGNINIQKQSSHPSEAFFHLGALTENKKTIIVEDKLSGELIKYVILSMGEAVKNLIEIKHIPGGYINVWNQVKQFSIMDSKNVMVFFDGDLEPDQPIPDEIALPNSENQNLDNIIQSFTKTKILFGVDGNKWAKNEVQLIELQRAFIKWSKKYVHFLPGKCNPEQLIWENMAHDASTEKVPSNLDFKKKFEHLTRAELAYPEFQIVNSTEIFQTQVRRLAKIENISTKFPIIVESINTLLSQA